MLHGATNSQKKTAAVFCLWHADTNFKWFSTLYRVQADISWCGAARPGHSVTHLSGRTKATSASDHRPSAPWVLSSAGKLIWYLHGSHFLPFRSADGNFPLLFFIRHLYLSVTRLGCSLKALFYIMSRHAPYCWLATSLFWYSAQTQFSNAFLKNDIPHL